MGRLIDADKLKAEFIGNRYGTRAIEYVIDQQPTVDAKSVVRCKDCANRGWEDECPLYESAYITGGGDEGSNFYCAWGERREDAVDR